MKKFLEDKNNLRMINRPVCAFITFEHTEMRDLALETLQES